MYVFATTRPVARGPRHIDDIRPRSKALGLTATCLHDHARRHNRERRPWADRLRPRRAIFCLAINFRQAHGLDSLDTGLALLPMTIVTGAMAFISGRVVPRTGEWPVILAGLAAGAGGALLVALNTSRGPLATLIASSVPLGFTALAMPAMTAVAMTHAPRHRIGLAAGVFNASRQTGGAFGIAVLGALLVAGHSPVSLHVAFFVTAGCYVAAIALAVAGHHHTGATTETRSRS